MTVAVAAILDVISWRFGFQRGLTGSMEKQNENDFQEGEFTAVEKPESSAPNFVVAGRRLPGTAKLIETINDGLKKIKDSGEYDRIVAKYKCLLSDCAD